MNKNKWHILFCILLAMCSSTLCATTIIQGQDSSYIGKKLCLYTWNDGWEYTKTILDTCTVAPNGQFTFEFTINETRKAQLTLGKYEGCIFVEPNKRYSVNLPVYETSTPADQLNPFYKPQELLLSLNQLPQDDINHQIAQFEDAFDEQWMELLSKEITPQRIEQAIAHIDSICPITENDFMEQYRQYRYALMVNLHASSAPDLSIRTYFLDQPVLYHQPAYWEAFEAIFPHFDHLSGLYSNTALFELAIMQKVSTGDLPVSKLKHITTPQNKEIAHFIEKNRSFLQQGHPIQLGTLVNIQGDSIASDNLNFPKAYVLFTNTTLNECKAIIAYADKMSKKYKDKCLFLVIFTDKNKKDIEQACKNVRQKTWFFAINENLHLTKEFNNPHVPAYFVLDASSKIAQTPAPEPKNFEP